MAATTISLSEKSQDVLHNNCISCSEMSQIAFLVKDEIKIIVGDSLPFIVLGLTYTVVIRTGRT